MRWLLMLLLAGPAAAAGLVLERTIPLPHVAGRIDHMAVDLRRQRLFVAELGQGAVDVIDLSSARVLRRIEGVREPQGVGYASDADVLAVASARDGSVQLFQGEAYAPVSRIELGDDADNIHTDPSGHFVVGYGEGLAVIDPAARTVLSRTPLPAHPEGFQLVGPAAFVNVPDAHAVARVELGTTTRALWRMPGLGGNFPMAVDPSGTLAVAFRSPPLLALLDPRSGRILAQIETCQDADDVFFDAQRRRLYVSCGEGAVDVVQSDAAGLHAMSRVGTSSGARTALFVPELDRLFVAARAGLFGSDAALLVFRPE